MKRLVLLLLFLGSSCGATIWYVSPTATTGNGSTSDPWNIYLALTNNSVTAGDSVYLRGGTYPGTGFFCNLAGNVNSPITISSYPREWAVLSDGIVPMLGTTMNASTSPIVLTNSEHLISSQYVVIGLEIMQLSTTSGSATNWIVNRGLGGTIATNHPAGSSAYVYAPYVLDHGSYSNVVFRNFEITSPMSTNRVWTYATNFAQGLNIGVGDKAIGLVIHDVAQPGIAAFVHVGGGYEINGCIIWGVGMFDTTGGFNEYRGSGIYAQNEGGGGLAVVKDCIFFRQTTAGAKVFGETGPVKDFQFLRCIAAMNGRSPLEIQSGSTATSNTWMNGCYVMGSPPISYVSTGNQKQYFVNNHVISGGFGLKETTNSVLTNNYVVMTKGSGDGVSPIQYESTLLSSNSLNLTWDYNTYVTGDGASPYQWSFKSSEGQVLGSLGGGFLTFSGDNSHSWKDWTGFDTHSTCITNWPNNYLNVASMTLDYNSNRHFIIVISTSGTTNAVLDLSTNGFNSGDVWTLRDAQNYFNVISVGTYTGGTINLPLNLTNIAQLQGSVTNFIPQHTNIQYPGLFNTFVLDRFSTLNFSGLSKLSGVIIQ